MLGSSSNRSAYDQLAIGAYGAGAPHLRHEGIVRRYRSLISRAFEAAESGEIRNPKVLDIGAGEGTITKQFLILGAKVLAVDVSSRQLEQLAENCRGIDALLEVRNADINDLLKEEATFDIVVANSLLHHIEDYMGLVEGILGKISTNGSFLCFQDPMWSSSLTLRDSLMSGIAYTWWRLQQGDLVSGAGRKIRRSFGVYLQDSLADNTEYHAVRNGVDQHALCHLLESHGFVAEIAEYCSFHSDFWQRIGERVGVRNTFGIFATRAKLDAIGDTGLPRR